MSPWPRITTDYPNWCLKTRGAQMTSIKRYYSHSSRPIDKTMGCPYRQGIINKPCQHLTAKQTSSGTKRTYSEQASKYTQISQREDYFLHLRSLLWENAVQTFNNLTKVTITPAETHLSGEHSVCTGAVSGSNLSQLTIVGP